MNVSTNLNPPPFYSVIRDPRDQRNAIISEACTSIIGFKLYCIITKNGQKTTAKKAMRILQCRLSVAVDCDDSKKHTVHSTTAFRNGKFVRLLSINVI